MYKITVSSSTQAQLAQHALYHPHPIVRRRMLSLSMLATGQTRKAVAHTLHIAPKTVRAHLKLYRTDGINGLLKLNYAPRAGALDLQRDRIVALLEEEPPATVKEAQARIATHLHLARCETQVRQFLKKIELSVEKSANCRLGRIGTPK